jgi:hypothetical protein
MSAPPEPAPGPQHPSRLELDVLLVDAAAAAPGTRAHVEACVGCSAYLGGLRAMAAEPLPAPLLAHTRRPRPKPPRPLARLLRPVFVAPSLAAAAALALVVLRAQVHQTNGGPAPDRMAAGVRDKGGPRIAVYLQRGPTVWRWDEQEVLRAGDRLRLEVVGAGYPRVTVVTPASGEGPKDADRDRLRALYAGPLPERGATLLPASWMLDAEGRSETLFVLFSTAPLSEAELRRSALLRPDLSVHKLVLRKE